MPICRQSITTLNLSRGSIDCQFNANSLPIDANSLRQSIANPLPIQKTDDIRVKYSTLSAANQPNPCQSGLFYVVEGLADLSRIGRLEKIDGDWLSLPSLVSNRQFSTNPPIHYQSNTNRDPVLDWRCLVNRWHIEVNPAQYQCQSVTNRRSDRKIVCRQSNANRPPICCQFNVNPVQTACQSGAGSHAFCNPISILRQSKPIGCQSSANPVPI